MWLAAGAGILILALGAGVKIQTSRLETSKAETAKVKAEYQMFREQVRVMGEAAIKLAKETEAANKTAKEKADAENKRSTELLQRTISKLRHDRDSAGAGSLPPAPASTSRPDLFCVDRAEYSRAYGAFVAGVRGLADEGSANTLKLSTSAEWAQSLAKH